MEKKNDRNKNTSQNKLYSDEIKEMELNGKKFKRKKLYNVMMRYIMPVIMMILFLQSTGVLNLIMK